MKPCEAAPPVPRPEAVTHLLYTGEGGIAAREFVKKTGSAMKQTHLHLKGHVYTRTGMDAEDDRWTVADVYFERGTHEARAVLHSCDGDTLELPVSRLRPPFWRSLY